MGGYSIIYYALKPRRVTAWVEITSWVEPFGVASSETRFIHLQSELKMLLAHRANR